MKTLLALLALIVMAGVLLSTETTKTGKVRTLRPEKVTINYYSKHGDRPPMPWAPPGVTYEITGPASCLLNDENYVYPKAAQAEPVK